jgi:hypothetical protein
MLFRGSEIIKSNDINIAILTRLLLKYLMRRMLIIENPCEDKGEMARKMYGINLSTKSVIPVKDPDMIIVRARNASPLNIMGRC